MLCVQVNLEPDMWTNRTVSRMVHSLPPEERVYEPEGTGAEVKKGEVVRAATADACGKWKSDGHVRFADSRIQDGVNSGGGPSWKREARSDFSFCVRAGNKVRVGQAIGRWLAY